VSTSLISFNHLTKRFGKQLAVNNLNAEIAPGAITGFLGPNGAGKSTALRCLLGLATPTSGTALIKGVPYSELENPLTQVGAVLDSRGFHTGLTARQNLRIITAAARLPDSRADEVLELVELGHVASKRTRGFSLGMKQRLSLAAALLGDPQILVLDEPANGLDPIGIAWLRGFLRNLADEGRTILVSSHQLAEMQHTVDDVIIINEGEVVVSGEIKEIVGDGTLEDAFLRLTLEAQKVKGMNGGNK
jgi:ABC-2 type transport system ATP-binding protein